MGARLGLGVRVVQRACLSPHCNRNGLEHSLVIVPTHSNGYSILVQYLVDDLLIITYDYE